MKDSMTKGIKTGTAVLSALKGHIFLVGIYKDRGKKNLESVKV